MARYLDIIKQVEQQEPVAVEPDQPAAPKPEIAELILRPATFATAMPTVGLAFPPCPVCGSQRYWISGPKVICGARRCGDVRWTLTHVEFHAVN